MASIVISKDAMLVEHYVDIEMLNFNFVDLHSDYKDTYNRDNKVKKRLGNKKLSKGHTRNNKNYRGY